MSEPRRLGPAGRFAKAWISSKLTPLLISGVEDPAHGTVALGLFIGVVVPGLAVEPATVTPAQAEKWLTATPGVQVLDVRTKEEFATGHLTNATLIPWTDKDFADRAAKELDPRKPVLVYCQGGVRSAKAAASLVKLGFTDVRDLAGGILAWQQAGKQIDKPAPKP